MSNTNTPNLSNIAPVVMGAQPLILIHSGPSIIKPYNDFLLLSLKSDDTRKTYMSALCLFFRFCDSLELDEVADIEPKHVKVYLDYRTKDLQKIASAPTHYFAIKRLFQYLVDKNILASNPAASVNYAFVRSQKGKTAVIPSADVRTLLLSIASDPLDEVQTAKHTDMRDRALIALMAYTFVRIGGALSANIEDYYFDDGEMWLDMIEKGAKSHTLPITGAAREYLDEYVAACSLSEPKAPLFQSANRNGVLTGNRYDRGNSRRMIRSRSKRAGIIGNVKNHTFRATGITRFLEGGGALDDAQDIANHSDSSTTRRYDRRDKKRLINALKSVDY